MTYTALHRSLGADPGPITTELLDEAIKAGVEETDDLDWKSDLPPAKNITQTDWPKDVAAMANSGGGLIIFGVKEQQKAATTRSDAGDLDENLERAMKLAAANAITPPVFGITFHKIGDDNHRAIVAEIPASPEAPHLIYKNDYFGAPIRNGADTHWMKERELESAYRTRFNERRNAHEALNNLHQETAAGRDTQTRAWLIFAAHPRVPVLATQLDQQVAKQALILAGLFSDPLTKGEGAHPLEVVERHNLRPGLRRWVARYIPAPGDDWNEAWISIHHDGSVTIAAAVGAHRTGANEYAAGNEVASTAVETAISDAMGVVLGTAEATRNSDYDIRVTIEWDGPEPLMLTTLDPFRRPSTDYTIPLHQYVPVETTVDARQPRSTFATATANLAQDCINQGGIAALQMINASRIQDQ